jgi:hypothetical protein
VDLVGPLRRAFSILLSVGGLVLLKLSQHLALYRLLQCSEFPIIFLCVVAHLDLPFRVCRSSILPKNSRAFGIRALLLNPRVVDECVGASWTGAVDCVVICVRCIAGWLEPIANTLFH